jgi:hypothetical protein
VLAFNIEHRETIIDMSLLEEEAMTNIEAMVTGTTIVEETTITEKDDLKII